MMPRAVLSSKWSGPRIGFGFINCPICKVGMMRIMRMRRYIRS